MTQPHKTYFARATPRNRNLVLLMAKMTNKLITGFEPRLEIDLFYPTDPDAALHDIDHRRADHGEWRRYPHKIKLTAEMALFMHERAIHGRHGVFMIEIP